MGCRRWCGRGWGCVGLLPTLRLPVPPAPRCVRQRAAGGCMPVPWQLREAGVERRVLHGSRSLHGATRNLDLSATFLDRPVETHHLDRTNVDTPTTPRPGGQQVPRSSHAGAMCVHARAAPKRSMHAPACNPQATACILVISQQSAMQPRTSMRRVTSLCPNIHRSTLL